ncbi:MAG: hypothetical protein U0X75_12265 [Acidobacteriota bacterium]
MKSLLSGIKNVLLWSYERGTWQYDILCLLIIAMVFLVPSRYFGDRDRVLPLLPSSSQAKTGAPSASNVSAQMAEAKIRFIETKELEAFLQQQNKLELLNSPGQAIVLYLRAELKREVVVLKQEPFMQEGRSSYQVTFQ